jgi:prepilin-type N-terminal cleavage/methylation domain-containing protein
MRNSRPARSERGFTLVEMMMAVMVIGILAAMATLQLSAVRPGMVADGAVRTVIGQLNYARELAISTRREIRIVPDLANHRLQLLRLPIAPATTVDTLVDIPFEGGVRLQLLGGVGDTPDAFGNGSAADFDSLTYRFGTDGTLMDDAGGPVNGTLFLLIPGQPASFRAVTVLGATGRVRGYRWNGTTWTRM